MLPTIIPVVFGLSLVAEQVLAAEPALRTNKHGKRRMRHITRDINTTLLDAVRGNIIPSADEIIKPGNVILRRNDQYYNAAGIVQIANGETVIVVNDDGALTTQPIAKFVSEVGGTVSPGDYTDVLRTTTFYSFFSSNGVWTASAVKTAAVAATADTQPFVPTATGIGAKVVGLPFKTTLDAEQKATLAAAAALLSAKGGAVAINSSQPISSANASPVVFPSIPTTPPAIMSSASVACDVPKVGNPTSGIGLRLVATSFIQIDALKAIVTSLPSPAVASTPSSTSAAASPTSMASSGYTSSSVSPTSDTATETATSTADTQADQQNASIVVPGQKLSVLPIGLGVFGALAGIALIVVGYMTYERKQYRKQFRVRRAAEAIRNAMPSR